MGKFKLHVAGDAVCDYNYDCLETAGLSKAVIQGCYSVLRSGRLGDINHSWIVYILDKSNKSSMEKIDASNHLRWRCYLEKLLLILLLAFAQLLRLYEVEY